MLEFKPFSLFSSSNPSSHVVGEEHNKLLVSWKEQKGSTVTYVASGNGSDNWKVLCALSADTDVVQATTTSDERLVAFVTQSRSSCSGVGDVRPCHPAGEPRYQAFVMFSDLQCQDVDEEHAATDSHEELIHLHFVDVPDSLCDETGNDERDLRALVGIKKNLLVLIHRHSVQLLQLEDERLPSKLSVAKVQIISLAFWWSQWFPSQRRLFLLHDTETEELGKPGLSATCLWFAADGTYDIVLDVSDQCFGDQKTALRDGARSRGEYQSCLNKISTNDLNLEAISDESGLVYLCHQPLRRKRMSRLSDFRRSDRKGPDPEAFGPRSVASGDDGVSSSRDDPSGTDRGRSESSPALFRFEPGKAKSVESLSSSGSLDSVDGRDARPAEWEEPEVDQRVDDGCTDVGPFLLYSVFVLHRRCRLDVYSHTTFLLHPCYFFNPTASHVMVWARPSLVHLLDVDASHDPGFHVFTEGEIEQDFPFSTKADPRTRLTKIRSKTISQSGFECVLSPSTGLGAGLVFNKRWLAKKFLTSVSLAERLDILHFFVVHDGRSAHCIRLLKALHRNPWSSHTVPLLQEFLLASSFADTGAQHPTLRHLADGLPLFRRGRLQENGNFVVRCLPCFHGWKIGFCKAAAALWRRQPLDIEPRKKERDSFLPESVLWETSYGLVEQPPDESAGNEEKPHNTSLLWSICRRISRTCGAGKKSGKSRHLSAGVSPVSDFPLPFPPVNDEDAVERERTQIAFGKRLQRHLMQFSARESERDIRRVVRSYVAQQVRQSRYLLHLVFASFGVNCADNRAYGFAKEMGPVELKTLYALLERYHVAVRLLAFPLPIGFRSTLALLAFHCIDHSKFLRHVSQGVLPVSSLVVLQIISSAGNDASAMPKILALLSLLPKSQRCEVAKHWDHAAARKILVEQIVTAVFRKKVVSSGSTRHNGLSLVQPVSRIPPVDCFVAAVQHQGNNRRNKTRLSDFTLGMIRAVILHTLE